MLNAPVHKEAPNRLIGNDQASAIWTIRLAGLAQSVASIAGRRSLYPSRGNCDVRGMSTSLPLTQHQLELEAATPPQTQPWPVVRSLRDWHTIPQRLRNRFCLEAYTRD